MDHPSQSQRGAERLPLLLVDQMIPRANEALKHSARFSSTCDEPGHYYKRLRSLAFFPCFRLKSPSEVKKPGFQQSLFTSPSSSRPKSSDRVMSRHSGPSASNSS